MKRMHWLFSHEGKASHTKRLHNMLRTWLGKSSADAELVAHHGDRVSDAEQCAVHG